MKYLRHSQNLFYVDYSKAAYDFPYNDKTFFHQSRLRRVKTFVVGLRSNFFLLNISLSKTFFLLYCSEINLYGVIFWMILLV